MLVQQLERRSLISLTDGLVCEIDGDGRLRAVAGHAEGELAGRLRAGVGRTLQEVIGPEHAAIWQRQIEGLVPGAIERGFPWSLRLLVPILVPNGPPAPRAPRRPARARSASG